MTISLIPRRPARGFTLAELMVAMAITVILLTLLVSVTGVALDGWRVSRNKVRASRQAKAALEQMSRDFEAMILRTGTNFEWLYTETDQDPPGPRDNESTNAARILMFSAATDRYEGDVEGFASWVAAQTLGGGVQVPLLQHQRGQRGQRLRGRRVSEAG